MNLDCITSRSFLGNYARYAFWDQRHVFDDHFLALSGTARLPHGNASIGGRHSRLGVLPAECGLHDSVRG